jgi:hypothetical protein
MTREIEENDLGTTIWCHIQTWRGRSFGATHYYCKLRTWEDGFIELTHAMTKEEAARLNELHRCEPGTLGAYRAGQIYNGFESPDEAKALAIAEYRKHFPHALRLVLGDPCYVEHQGILHEVKP